MPEIRAENGSPSAGRPEGAARLEPKMEKELAEIRKEVVESRNLVIKTDNLLKNLHAELKQVAQKQQEIAQRSWVGSFVAYLAIAALAAAGANLTINARAGAAHDETTSLSHQIEELRTSEAKLEKEATDRKQAADQAARAYVAIAEGTPDSRLKGVDALANLDRSRLTPLESRALDDRARLLKVELASSALDEGRNAFKRQDFATAAPQLTRFLTLAPDSPDALQACLMLGNSLHAQKQYAEAIPPLERFVANGKGMKSLDYAMFMLGQSYEMTGEHAKAIDVLTRGITEHPASEFLLPMRHVLAEAHAALAPTPPPPGARPVAPAVAPIPAHSAAAVRAQVAPHKAP